jgi:hypothetical protein
MAKADLRKRTIEELPKRIQNQVKTFFDERVKIKEVEDELKLAKSENSAAVLKVIQNLDIDQIQNDLAMFTMKFSAPRLSKDLLYKALLRHGMRDKEIEDVLEESMSAAGDEPFIEFRFKSNGKAKKK